ncbi:MAG: GTP pyrophosphokinase family protein [Clostridia bacterium]|nr:GTP pyrophosphokinase family protein [Clostridia bacterium]
MVLLEGAIENVTAKLNLIRKYKIAQNDRDPIEYISSRIKSEDSMKEKLTRKGLEVTLENALTKVYDAVGMRIICAYIDDVYTIVDMLKKYKDLKLIKEKDYIKNPKPNGYRSYHIIFELSLDLAGETHPVFVEIQIRTIAMDFWSSLEHQMKYKKDIKNQELIVEELAKCASEIATTDIKMQTIRKMINKEE